MIVYIKIKMIEALSCKIAAFAYLIIINWPPHWGSKHRWKLQCGCWIESTAEMSVSKQTLCAVHVLLFTNWHILPRSNYTHCLLGWSTLPRGGVCLGWSTHPQGELPKSLDGVLPGGFPPPSGRIPSLPPIIVAKSCRAIAFLFNISFNEVLSFLVVDISRQHEHVHSWAARGGPSHHCAEGSFSALQCAPQDGLHESGAIRM